MLLENTNENKRRAIVSFINVSFVSVSFESVESVLFARAYIVSVLFAAMVLANE